MPYYCIWSPNGSPILNLKIPSNAFGFYFKFLIWQSLFSFQSMEVRTYYFSCFDISEIKPLPKGREAMRHLWWVHFPHIFFSATWKKELGNYITFPLTLVCPTVLKSQWKILMCSHSNRVGNTVTDAHTHNTMLHPGCVIHFDQASAENFNALSWMKSLTSTESADH